MEVFDRDDDLYSAVCEAVFLAFDVGKNDTNESVFPSNELR